MRRHTRRRFLLQAVAAGTCALLAVVTVLWRDWIEILFGVDPDRGSGALEWLVVFALAAAAIGLSIMARREWHRVAWAAAPTA